MTEWAKVLEFEYSTGYLIRLDIKRLTVVVDRNGKPTELSRIGSGENWVSFHILTFLALHKYFHSNHRPVPAFLFIDQPSQVYFPSDNKKLLVQESDPDRRSVRKLFELIFDTVDSLAPNFQVIITEHAEFQDDRFKQNIVESWEKEGTKLVPDDWMPSDELKAADKS